MTGTPVSPDQPAIPSQSNGSVQQNGDDLLTRRERQAARRRTVQQLRRLGVKGDELAKQVGASPSTIDRDLKAIREANQRNAAEYGDARYYAGDYSDSVDTSVRELWRMFSDVQKDPSLSAAAKRRERRYLLQDMAALRAERLTALQSLGFSPKAAARIELDARLVQVVKLLPDEELNRIFERGSPQDIADDLRIGMAFRRISGAEFAQLSTDAPALMARLEREMGPEFAEVAERIGQALAGETDDDRLDDEDDADDTDSAS